VQQGKMQRNRFGVRSALMGLAIAAATAGTANATVLTFNATPQFGDDQNLGDAGYADYGDNVTASDLAGGHVSGVNGKTYLYGSGGGATPNVTTAFTTSGPINGNRIYQGYGDLAAKSAYLSHSAASGSPTPANEIDFLTFTANPGYNVTLEGIDFAALSAGSTLRVFRIFTNNTGLGVPAYDAVALNAGASVPVPNVGHSSYTSAQFGTITAPVIRIEMSKDFLSSGPYYNIAYDNVQFSQSVAVVPEPAGLALLGLGGLALLRRRLA
jgi:hypothetical protein